MEDDGDDDMGVSFWDELDSMAVAPQRGRSVLSAVPRVDLAGSMLQVPVDRRDEVQLRMEVLAAVSGAKLEMTGSLLRITGSFEARQRAERYGRAMVDIRSTLEEHPDVTHVPVTEEWATARRGFESKYESGNSLIIFEPPTEDVSRSLTQGLIVEAQRGDANSSGEKKWLLAVVLGRINAWTLRLQWCFDASTDEVPSNMVRHTWKAAIFAPSKMDRIITEVNLMVAFEESAKGSIAARMEKNQLCGGIGMDYTALHVKKMQVERHWNRLKKAATPARVRQATGCLKVEIFIKPEWAVTSDSQGEELCVLTVGTRHQRWIAQQAFVAYNATLDMNHQIRSLPPILASECRVMAFPTGMMAAFLGPQFSNVQKMMEETNAFVFKFRERLGTTVKRAAEDSADVMAIMMEQLRTGPAMEVLIFGTIRAQYAVEIKIRAMVEERYRGYHDPDAQGTPGLVLGADGQDIDMVWLKGEFEDSASRTQAEILSGASNCLVESAGKTIFLAGSRKERDMARDYLQYMTSKKMSTGLVPETHLREDAMEVKVPDRVLRSSWLTEQLEKLSAQSGVTAFFDAWQEPPWGRIVIMGRTLGQSGEADTALLASVKGLVDEALSWTLRSSEPELCRNWWKLAGNMGADPGSGQPVPAPLGMVKEDDTAVEVKEAAEPVTEVALEAPESQDELRQKFKGAAPPEAAIVRPTSPGRPKKRMRGAPPPACAVVTLGGRLLSTDGNTSNVPAPATPALPGKSVPAPATPAPGGAAVVAPSTPAPCVAAPATPAPRNVPAPATPAPRNVAAPATPAPRNVPAPCTPAPHAVAAPRTPAPGAPPPASARVGAPPPTGSRVEPTPGGAVPSTARVSAPPPAAARVGALPDLGEGLSDFLPPPGTPAGMASGAPATPAGLRSSAPMTPAAIRSLPARDLAAAAPRTPAAIAGNRGTMTPAFAGRSLNPQTPAFTGVGARAGPGTPARVRAPGTPAAISGTGRPVPQTPAAIGGAGKSNKAVPATPGAILTSGPPSPTAAPPSRAPVAVQPAQPPSVKEPAVQGAGAKLAAQNSRFAPKRGAAATVVEEAPVEEEAPTSTSIHHGMTYAEWVRAKAEALRANPQ